MLQPATPRAGNGDSGPAGCSSQPHDLQESVWQVYFGPTAYLLQPELGVDYDRRHEMLEMSGSAVLQVRYYVDYCDFEKCSQFEKNIYELKNWEF